MKTHIHTHTKYEEKKKQKKNSQLTIDWLKGREENNLCVLIINLLNEYEIIFFLWSSNNNNNTFL